LIAPGIWHAGIDVVQVLLRSTPSQSMDPGWTNPDVNLLVVSDIQAAKSTELGLLIRDY
jgi:hypothetical protein